MVAAPKLEEAIFADTSRFPISKLLVCTDGIGMLREEAPGEASKLVDGVEMLVTFGIASFV